MQEEFQYKDKDCSYPFQQPPEKREHILIVKKDYFRQL